MDNPIIDSAVNDLFSKPFIRGFRALAINRNTGLDESEIENYLDHLVDTGMLSITWQLICKNCCSLHAEYDDKPESIESFCCSRCGAKWRLDIDDLKKMYYRGK